MNYKNLLDTHTHTDNSPDGNHSAMYMCEKAMEHGLRAIAFTDHCEADAHHDKGYRKPTMQSFFETLKARSAFMGKLIVLTGIELGQAVYNPALADEIIAARPYDFVLGSLHNLEGEQDFYFMDFTEMDPYPLLDRYYHDLLMLVEWGNFDSLAHLTYPLRYMIGKYHLNIDMKRYDGRIDDILKALIRKGKALEINTAGLRQEIGDFIPDRTIVQRFHDLGGVYITLGSDAHFAEHTGAGIAEGMKLAKECGFDTIALYENREPIMITIE